MGFVALSCSSLEERAAIDPLRLETLSNACTDGAQSADDSYKAGRSSGAGHHKYAIAMAHAQMRWPHYL